MPKISKQDLNFIFRDQTIFALNKPALIHSVLNPRGSDDAIAAALLEKYPALARAALKEGDGGLLQRLDFETSGVILGAWDRASWLEAKEALNKFGEKEYLFVTNGRFPKSKNVSGFIGAKGRSSKKVRVYRARSPRSTFVETLFSLEEFNSRSGRSLVRARTSTGARHQIRASAAAIGFPLAGDTLYGGAALSLGLEIPPFFLHAAVVSINPTDPSKRRTIEAPPPKYLKNFLGS